MSDPSEREPEKYDPFAGPFEQARMAKQNRRDRIVAEIQANRRGDYTVPTWVLATALGAMIAVIIAVLLIV